MKVFNALNKEKVVVVSLRSPYDNIHLKGHKIKASLRFKGRQMAHTELGEEVLLRFAEALKDVAMVESAPKLEGRNMTMILAPKK